MLEWQYAKNPGTSSTYTVEWGDFLDGATITNSSWVLPTGITNAGDGHDDNDSTVKISGGTDNTEYILSNTITDSNGDEWERSVILNVKER